MHYPAAQEDIYSTAAYHEQRANPNSDTKRLSAEVHWPGLEHALLLLGRALSQGWPAVEVVLLPTAATRSNQG